MTAQNALHTRAGISPSDSVGSAESVLGDRYRCPGCSWRGRERDLKVRHPPTCPRCGSKLKQVEGK